ncbi:uncharacterized protein LOC135692489 [Rhopilema esculentum]|uniref:uncharacterized protein LOC135692489 n=1 Tax=Rhopilema esculentum TaxID=499914 RepID=UPI0031E3A22F|eukprot:gene1982-17528_t
MFEFVGRCFHSNIWGFCSRKSKYVGFRDEERRQKQVSLDPRLDPAWDADVDALNEMEYNLVAEQPKGIKLELHDPDTIESPREKESDEEEKTPSKADWGDKLTPHALDIVNQNEMSDLIPEDKSDSASSS